MATYTVKGYKTRTKPTTLDKFAKIIADNTSTIKDVDLTLKNSTSLIHTIARSCKRSLTKQFTKQLQTLWSEGLLKEMVEEEWRSRKVPNKPLATSSPKAESSKTKLEKNTERSTDSAYQSIEEPEEKSIREEDGKENVIMGSISSEDDAKSEKSEPIIRAGRKRLFRELSVDMDSLTPLPKLRRLN
ncbi:uncharacterized protein LOC106646647 [Copidosoma floridanum]|uniref:uncharacterized protein LOC106646647 n=1 Tax=Copidosoma floridanum TaxID=29053 RepID=UPI0006C99184|nr:uncharacterized protein LOC106646647 [Copidosoma floridanum]